VNQPTTQPKDPGVLGLMAVILLCPATVFMVVADAPQTMALVLLGLLVSAVWRQPLARTTRSYVYTTMAALVAMVGQHQLLPAHAERFFLMPGEIYCPLLLYLAVAMTFFEARESIVAAVVALAILATVIAGNVVSFHSRDPMFLQFVDNMVDFHRLYGIAALIETVAIPLLLGRAARQHSQDSRPRRGRLAGSLVLTACLAIAALVAFAMYSSAIGLQRGFQDILASFLQRYGRQRTRDTLFGRQVDLWRTAAPLSRRDQTVVLRVRSKRVPGYLRGYAYQSYEFGQWDSDDGNAQLLQPLPNEAGPITFRVFERFAPPPPDQSERLDILPASGFRSQVLLLPGDASRIEIISTEVRLSPDGVMFAGSWEPATGYVAVAPRLPLTFSYPGPAGNRLDPAPYLEVPGYLRPALREIAAEAFAGLPDDAPPEAAIAAVVNYLKHTCHYELGVQMEMHGGDPVVQFLTNWRRGHCELFAASAALLLRLRGVPTRYVTGFVCVEQPPGVQHYVARLADAHAWAEAYNDRTGTWELVEATPAAGIPHDTSETTLFGSLLDSLVLVWQRMLALMKRGYIAQALFSFFLGIWGCLRYLFANPWRATAIVGSLALLVYWFRHRRRQRHLARIREMGAARWLLRRPRELLLKRFQKAGVTAAPADTLRHLLARLASSQAPLATALAPVIGEYEQLRYGPEQPSPEDVRQFERRLRSALRGPTPKPDQDL